MDDIAALRKHIQEDMVHAVALLLPRLVEKGMTTDDPDVIRKIVGTLISPAGLEADKKLDQFAGLPTTNIQILISGQDSAVQTITVDTAELPAPTPAMLANTSINEDVAFDE